MERHFEAELEKLKTRILKMCSLVDEQFESAIKAINEENFYISKQVI